MCPSKFVWRVIKKHNRIHFLTIQDEGGTKKIVEKVLSQIRNLLAEANKVERTSQSVNHLTLALQCGGSDGYSGITANPALGVAADLLVKKKEEAQYYLKHLKYMELNTYWLIELTHKKQQINW